MKHAEEQYANELHRLLQGHLANHLPTATVTIGGEGVHWHCEAQREVRSVRIHCFDAYSRGCEFYPLFREAKDDFAAGRSHSQTETIDATTAWLQGATIATLYDRWEFVDRNKRALSRLRYDVLRRIPDLVHLTNELDNHLGDMYSLWFWGRHRSCEIAFDHGMSDKYPIATCHWDQSELFSFPVEDMDCTADVLHRWLCEEETPSTMRQLFPALKIGGLADYYERGEGVVGEFLASWDVIEAFYADLDFPLIQPVQLFVRQLREHGYDRTLRAGQSLWSLILSRSRQHGLRTGQPSVAFDFHHDGLTVYGLDRQPQRFTTLAPNEVVLAELNALQAMAID